MAVSEILPMSHAKYNEQLFRSAAFSDCIIKCQHRIWHLHRAILSPRCEFFWKCFAGPWEESSAIVSMHDDDPDSLERMLRWIYTLEWPETRRETEIWTSDLLLYNIADKYGLSVLMEQAREALMRTAESCWHTDDQAHLELFVNNIDDFVEILHWFFDDVSVDEHVLGLEREILQIMAPMIAQHLRKQPRLAALLKDIPALGVELVEALARSNAVDCSKGLLVDYQSFQGYNSNSRSISISNRGAPSTKVHIPMNEDSEDELD